MNTEVYRKPKMVDKIEKKFGKDINTLLIETTKKYKNMRDQAGALNVSITYLYSLIKRYFGNVNDFMCTHTTGWRKRRYRNLINGTPEA